jgi:hypothetical protein
LLIFALQNVGSFVPMLCVAIASEWRSTKKSLGIFKDQYNKNESEY